jgi:hypothetical protein
MYRNFKLLSLLVIFIILPNLLIGQNIHIASGILNSPKISDSDHNYQSIPILFGIDYLLKERIYLTSNLGYYKLGYNNNGEKLILDNVYFNTAMDYYFVKDFPVRPFLGTGVHLSYLINSNQDDLTSNMQAQINKLTYGFLLRFGARQKFTKFEIAIIIDYNFNINNQGTFNNERISGNSEAIMFYLGIPIRKNSTKP